MNINAPNEGDWIIVFNRKIYPRNSYLLRLLLLLLLLLIKNEEK